MTPTASAPTLEFRLNPTGTDPLARAKATTERAERPVETRSTVRPRARAVRFAVPGGGTRSEIEPLIRDLREGDDLYFGYRGYLPRDFPVNAGGWQVIEQWRSAAQDTSRPTVAIEISKGRFVLTGGSGAPGGPKPYRVAIGKAVAGRAVDLVTRIRFSADRARARVDVWLDGRRTVTDFHPPAGTLDPPQGSTAVLKAGLHRDDAIRQSATLLLDDLRISRTYRGAAGT